MSKTVIQCVQDSRLNSFNSRQGIRHLLEIPSDIDLNNLKDEILKCYTYFYIEKRKNDVIETKEDRIKRYLSPNTEIIVYEKRPEDYSEDKYRMLINIRKNWLKKTLKKINKILSRSLIEKINKEVNYYVPYLHSSVVKRSYETNAKSHKNNKYILAIDIQNFYPSIKIDKVFKFFRNDLNLDVDIAKIYSILCTCPLDDPQAVNDYELGLGQGLATSPILAFLVVHNMFDYMYKISSRYNINMTVYVDDVVFSSDNKIPQEFIDILFGIVKSNNMNIKKEKVKYYPANKIKKITGIFITNTNRVRVSKSKHEEIYVQFNYLTSIIDNIKNINDYFNVYNLYIKFRGNIQFVNLVEENVLTKYKKFLLEYDNFFINGIKKKNKKFGYSKENVYQEDYNKILQKYKEIKKYVDDKKAKSITY